MDDWCSIPGRGRGFFLYTVASRQALESAQPSTRWVPRYLSPEVKWPGLEAEHSPPSGANFKNAWSGTSIPQYVFIAWFLVKRKIRLMAWYLVKQRDNLTFTVKVFLAVFVLKISRKCIF
jgi:hypothetical protein